MELIEEARRTFAGRAGATVSHPRFLEFVAPGVSKGRAVAWLAQRAGIPMGQVMAVGDALNDIEMIGDAGHGAAMATAPAIVRAAGRYVAAPVDEDGAAALIEALVLAPPDEARAQRRERLGGGGPRRARRRLVTATRMLPDGDAARAEAVALLRAGRIVAIPTDTVYGIARRPRAAGRHRAAVRGQAAPAREGRRRAARRRRPGLVARGRAPAAALLAERFWPGGLTLVLPVRARRSTLPRVLAAGTPTIGVRVPDHAAPRALAAALGPLPTTSANLSGEPDARDAAEVAATLGEAIALVIDGGPIRGGPASTVVDCTTDRPAILRPGAIDPSGAGRGARRGRDPAPHRRSGRSGGRAAQGASRCQAGPPVYDQSSCRPGPPAASSSQDEPSCLYIVRTLLPSGENCFCAPSVPWS